jgi:hypothetical protein
MLEVTRDAYAQTAAAAPSHQNCFPAGTPVSTEIGLRNIESVRAGERVWAYEQFTHVHDGELVRVTVAGDVIESTPHHPYWVERGADLDARPRPEHVPENPAGYTGIGRWVDAADVRTGDVLRLRSGELVPIGSVEVRRWRGRVYNFHVEGLQCYAVGDAMVRKKLLQKQRRDTRT